MGGPERAVVRFPKDRIASYHAALLFLIAARDLLEDDKTIDLPPFGEPLTFKHPVNVPKEIADFIDEAWEQTTQLIANTEPSSTTEDDIRAGIAIGWQLLSANPSLPFSSPEYEKWRNLITTRFIIPQLDTRPHWPPPLQTLLNHFGPTWDDVKTSAGWQPPEPAPRTTTAPQVPTEELEEMLTALRLFIAHCEKTRTRTAQARYKGWAGVEHEQGRYRPAAQHIRDAFGTWTNAITTARGF
ncbi:hypothetical protein [Bowdeniella nasicola]|uniref:hypothetical protein n=1 Tax=Bowdeniella nasicola TaxID=208480 RepID=UPI00116131F3|nr:hypothetical protein [Bowdeniella nasicola]